MCNARKYCLFLKRAVFNIRRVNATLTEEYFSSCASPGRHNAFSVTATKPYSSSVHVSRSDGLCFSPRHITTPAHVQAAAICCWWRITVTYFIFDPNPRSAEKQLLSCSGMKTVSALIDSGSAHKNKLSRRHNLAMVHVSLYCTEHQATGEFI